VNLVGVPCALYLRKRRQLGHFDRKEIVPPFRLFLSLEAWEGGEIHHPLRLPCPLYRKRNKGKGGKPCAHRVAFDWEKKGDSIFRLSLPGREKKVHNLRPLSIKGASKGRR